MRSSSGRRKAKRFQAALTVLVFLAVVAAALFWQFIPSPIPGRALRGVPPADLPVSPEAAEAAVPAGLEDDPEAAAALQVLQRKLGAGRPAPETQLHEAVTVLGRRGVVQAAPLLRKLLADENETSLMRGDALHALALLHPEEGQSVAETYRTAEGHLGNVAQRILTRDPDLMQRQENVQRFVEGLD